MGDFPICQDDRVFESLNPDQFFRDSSMVEQSAVNRLVVGSNPTHGAINIF